MKGIPKAGSLNWIASEEEREPEVYPELYNLSAAFMFRFLVRPDEAKKPEFLYIPLKGKSQKRLELTGVMGQRVRSQRSRV